MPFTPAHAAVVLPLRRLGLPLSALVAGATVPDTPMFLPGRPGYDVTHSLWAVLTLDVLLASFAVWLWFAMVRDAYADVTPWVRDRVPARARLSARQWTLVPVAAVLGALTHVVWDSATHEGRPVAETVPWLATEHAGIAGAQWAQWASGVLGLLVVVAYTVRWLAREPVAPRASRVSRPLAWFLVAPAAAVVAGTVALAGADALHHGAVGAAVAGVQGLVLAAAVTGACWHRVVARARRPRPAGVA
ncbi:uncharacterized protein DUF4184 [Isoptericola jiangsuensis]|uniref:Uncharacterized protein DUF4184 n=1 Tax=Isoptericola jiangsuensis TaxID=548579 RepID=A0A2A9F0M9_9MICO|nr:DUF4184 family protein [Isoptericola jiangsuensis]PFG44854.1 uncharacterized protein DUF4184 [Isoptericola jiangsuensis]